MNEEGRGVARSTRVFGAAHSGTLWHVGLPRFTREDVKHEDMKDEGRAEGARGVGAGSEAAAVIGGPPF